MVSLSLSFLPLFLSLLSPAPLSLVPLSLSPHFERARAVWRSTGSASERRERLSLSVCLRSRPCPRRARPERGKRVLNPTPYTLNPKPCCNLAVSMLPPLFPPHPLPSLAQFHPSTCPLAPYSFPCPRTLSFRSLLSRSVSDTLKSRMMCRPKARGRSPGPPGTSPTSSLPPVSVSPATDSATDLRRQPGSPTSGAGAQRTENHQSIFRLRACIPALRAAARSTATSTGEWQRDQHALPRGPPCCGAICAMCSFVCTRRARAQHLACLHCRFVALLFRFPDFDLIQST